MHPNPAFRKTPTEANLAFARQRGFGTLCVNGPEGPILAHVPFLLADDGGTAAMHLARSNGILQNGLPAGAVLAVQDHDFYVSPDWYGIPDQVPTWNYVAVHLRGRLEPVPMAELEAHVNALSDEFEARLAPKPVWTSAKMGEGVMARMLRMILPVRLVIERVDGTWKMGQNKSEGARAGVMAALEAGGPAQADRLAAMRALPEG
jgi:transcriptional regulator